MIYFHSAKDYYLPGPCAVTLGKFDGLHRGHQRLLKEIRQLQAKGRTGVVFVLRPGKGPFLTTLEEEKKLLDEMGIMVMIDCPFIPEISGMNPGQFVREILIDRLHASDVIVGTDFRFGKDRAGDTVFLEKCGQELGFRTSVIPKETFEGTVISSTYIRDTLTRGEIEKANAMTGRPYSVSGTIIHGAHLGTGIGMPTINVVPENEKQLPPDGVYFTLNKLQGRTIPGVTNIGCKPTVNGRYRGVETFLYDTEGDLYSLPVETQLLHFVRPERKFNSLEDLRRQMENDKRSGREYFHEQGVMDSRSVAGCDRTGSDSGGHDSGCI